MQRVLDNTESQSILYHWKQVRDRTVIVPSPHGNMQAIAELNKACAVNHMKSKLINHPIGLCYGLAGINLSSTIASYAS